MFFSSAGRRSNDRMDVSSEDLEAGIVSMCKFKVMKLRCIM